MNILKQIIALLYIGFFCIGIVSCSPSKKMATELNPTEKEEVAALKSKLKFKTHYGLKGDTDIKATNLSSSILDISDLTLFVAQEGTDNYQTLTLEDLHIAEKLNINEVMAIQLPLDEIIERDFESQAVRYNVSIVYNSKKPLKNDDERNIYFFTYTYKGK